MEEIYTNEKFMLNRKEYVDRSILKKDFVRYTPSSLATINNETPFRIQIPREDAFISLQESYLEIELDVVKNADDTRYADGNGIQLVNLGGIALFSEMGLTSSGTKFIEKIENVYLASLMYKMLSSSDEEMMTNFRKDDVVGAIEVTKRNRLINDSPEKGKMFVRVSLADVFGFVLHQDKITYGLGYTLTLKRANAGNAIFRTIADVAKLTINDIGWYVPHYTPSIDNQSLVNEIVLAKEATTLSYIQRNVWMKPVNSNNKWTFELGVEAGMDIPIYVIVGFQSAARFGPDQAINNGVFDRLDVIEANCKVGSERYPEAEMQIDFNRNKYNDAYQEVMNFYKDFVGGESTPYISFKDFKELYNLWVFDLRAQKQHIASQPIQVNFTFRAGYDAVGDNYQAIGLVLSNKMISISSDGQRQFDLI